MNEKQITQLFHDYLKKHPREDSETYELKCIKSDSLNYSIVAEHQVKGLLDSLEGMWYKIPDMSAINGFSARKPFDAFWMKAKRGFIVPVFYKPRRYKQAFLIPIKEFIKFKGKSMKRTELEKFNFEMFYL